jgi:hypothetical protein
MIASLVSTRTIDLHERSKIVAVRMPPTDRARRRRVIARRAPL